MDLLKITEEMERDQARSVQDVRANRDGAAVRAALERLQRACRDPKDNLMPHLIDCRQRLLHRRRDRRGDGAGLRPLHRAFGILGGGEKRALYDRHRTVPRPPYALGGEVQASRGAAIQPFTPRQES